eukprot:9373144-Alexandrium_andersonii.AAC.1
MSAVRLPGRRLVIQREVRLRGPGAPTKREIRASEEDLWVGGMRHPLSALSLLPRASLFRGSLRPCLESYFQRHPEFELYIQGLMGGSQALPKGESPP